jgi:hypothetical protein
MSINFDALVLGPAYATFGKDATYTPFGGAPTTIRVIDETQGKVTNAGDRGSPAVVEPAVNVRIGDVAESPSGGQIEFNGNVWKIRGSMPQVGPGGIATGELTLTLEKQ